MQVRITLIFPGAQAMSRPL